MYIKLTFAAPVPGPDRKSISTTVEEHTCPGQVGSAHTYFCGWVLFEITTSKAIKNCLYF